MTIKEQVIEISKSNLLNKRFGRLLVIEETNERSSIQTVIWKCKCDCGNITYVDTNRLTSGNTKSCGCLSVESYRKPKIIKHGDCNSNSEFHRLYIIWKGMKSRCNNQNGQKYKDYGGRGISVCEEWNEYMNFKDWALSNGYRSNLTIDRIDVNGNYEPNNCRWSDAVTQMNNMRTNTHIEYNGVVHTIAELARKYNLKQNTLIRRLNLGWSVDDALNKPVREVNKK